jgi:hypothetical protein
MLIFLEPTAISSSKDFIEQHKAELIDYYKAILESSEHSAAEQEAFNRQDLEDIAQGPWGDISDEERGLIALLCNRLL